MTRMEKVLRKELADWKNYARHLRFAIRELGKCDCGRMPHSTHCRELRAGAALSTRPQE